jgi:hypothetical protein
VVAALAVATATNVMAAEKSVVAAIFRYLFKTDLPGGIELAEERLMA